MLPVQSLLRPPIKPTVKRPEADTDENDRRRVKSRTSDEEAPPAWLPQIPQVRWEWKLGGSVIEAWHNKTGQRGRSNADYLGRIGKKRMQAYAEMNPDEAAKQVTDWVAEKQKEKGFL